MWRVLLVPSSSPTLLPIYDGLDVNVTSNVTWFHLNHDMVSRRIYKLSFYGGHSITNSIYMCAEIIKILQGDKSDGCRRNALSIYITCLVLFIVLLAGLMLGVVYNVL